MWVCLRVWHSVFSPSCPQQQYFPVSNPQSIENGFCRGTRGDEEITPYPKNPNGVCGGHHFALPLVWKTEVVCTSSCAILSVPRGRMNPVCDRKFVATPESAVLLQLPFVVDTQEEFQQGRGCDGRCQSWADQTQTCGHPDARDPGRGPTRNTEVSFNNAGSGAPR